MSKYSVLWEYIFASGKDELSLLFGEIGQICGFPIDHSLLTYKKELSGFGWSLKKVSMKEKAVTFEREKGAGA